MTQRQNDYQNNYQHDHQSDHQNHDQNNSDCILEITNISKTFPGVVALNGINLCIKKNTVHALMGENGAGKSTLMKILYGIYTPDKGGVIKLDGQDFVVKSPIDAIRKGLSMVPQEISPAPNLTITDNFFLGREYTDKFGFLDESKMHQYVSNLLEELGIPMDVTLSMSLVPIAKAQLLAIAMAISFDSKVIIMDEPTTALTESEVAQLFDMIKKVKERGIAVIYISHKLDEIFSIADEVSILRDGHYVATHKVNEITKNELIELMVGRSMSDMFDREEVPIGARILEVKNLGKTGVFHDISFEVHQGEIFGIAGLVGAGRSELTEALFGYKPADSGDIYMHGKKIEIHSPNDAMKNKIGFVTEDRKETGLFLNLNVVDNMVMPDLIHYIKSYLISDSESSKAAEDQKVALNIKTPDVHTITEDLSGGNQQKVLLARWLLLEPDILILDEPTKGIDVGAKAELYKIMVELARTNKGIIMISSDMLELLAMSDRIMVMAEGAQVGIISKEDATQELVLAMAAGLSV